MTTITVSKTPVHARRYIGVLGWVWRDRRISSAVAVGVTALAGLLSALVMPRGPITTGLALTAIITGVAVGFVGGLALRSRWALLLVPIVFAAVFELGRIGTDGPLVDGIHLGTLVEILAFVLGRGFHGVVGLLPMVLGAVYGAALARRLSGVVARPPRLRSRIGLYLRRGGTALISVGLIALAMLIAQPAHTDPILGPDGAPLPGSVAELATVRIGGHDQVLLIRGTSVDHPVLLYLAGGPGGTDIGAFRLFLEELEQDFVVVVWDQRGTGKSYAALDPTATLTLDQIVADTIEVTTYLRDRFDERKIYLVGNSWGTTLGVLAVQQHPEVFHAYIGTGQMVSQTATDRMFREDTLAYAERTGNDDLARTLRAYGGPPYDDVMAVAIMAPYERAWNAYARVPAYDARGEMPQNLLVDEYTLVEKVQGLAATMDTFSVVYPQLKEIDFRQQATRLDVPVYLVQGRHEARGRAVLATEWFEQLQAPSKQLILFEHSGHRPLFEEPDRFRQVMTETVLRETQPGW